MKYRICKRCVMDTSDKDIKFDKNGYCNHCNDALNRKKNEVFGGNVGKKKFDDFVDMLKKEGKGKKYDCVIGISGGVDSSYLAYLLSKKGLRILGVHVDGGWDTDISSKNIKLICSKCNIELVNIMIDEKEMFSLQKAYFLSGVINQDVPQDHAFFATLYNFLKKHKIKYFISGHNWVSESITPLSWGFDAYDSTNIKDIYKKYTGRSLKHYPLLSFFNYKILIPYMYGIKKIRPLNYIDYDPTKALDILKEKIGYLDYGSKHCESSFTRLLQCYIQPKKYGFEKRRAHLSSLIVSGKLNRNEALKILSEQPCSELQLESDINEFIRKIDISKEKFNEIINDKNYHSHYDFKTNEVKNNIFKKIRKILGKR